jgi:tetratricopeptide (TPR) repeat protein
LRSFGRIAIAAVAVTLFSPASHADPAHDRQLAKAAVIVSRGDHALDAGNLDKAEQQYAKALRLLPELPEAHVGLGRVFMARSRFEEAYRAFREAERCYRAEAASLQGLRNQRYRDAQVRASDLHRRSSILKFNIHRLEALLGESDGRSEQRQSDQLAALMMEVRQLDEEVRRLEQVPPPPHLADDGVPGELFFHLGNALHNLGRTNEAIAAWENCVERSPEFPLAYVNLAAAYWALERPREAWSRVEEAERLGVEIHPDLRRALCEALAADLRPASE